MYYVVLYIIHNTWGCIIVLCILVLGIVGISRLVVCSRSISRPKSWLCRSWTKSRRSTRSGCGVLPATRARFRRRRPYFWSSPVGQFLNGDPQPMMRRGIRRNARNCHISVERGRTNTCHVSCVNVASVHATAWTHLAIDSSTIRCSWHQDPQRRIPPQRFLL